MIYRRERSSGQNGGLRTTWTNCAYGRTSGVLGSFLGVICFGFLNFFLPILTPNGYLIVLCAYQMCQVFGSLPE